MSPSTESIRSLALAGHAGAGNLRGVFVASYTDTPVDEGVPPLSDSDEVTLRPGETPAPAP